MNHSKDASAGQGRPTSTSLQGLAAEYLVCADLCKQGYPAALSPGNGRYDVVVDVSGQLLRVQVKSTAVPREHLSPRSTLQTYYFRMSNSRNDNRINTSEIEVVALVALDINVIAYLPPSQCAGKARVQLKPPGRSASKWSKNNYNIDQLPFSKLLEELRQ